jgi:hypothetical protein
MILLLVALVAVAVQTIRLISVNMNLSFPRQYKVIKITRKDGDTAPLTIHYNGEKVFLGFTMVLYSESDGGSTLNVLMLMLHWSEKMIRNCTYLPPNTDQHIQ